MPTSPTRLHVSRRPAMHTLFEIALLGEDVEHLTVAAEAALNEIERIERLLSRFDPASEVSRLNRETAHGPVLVDYELLDILCICRDGWERTDGYFDIAATSATKEATSVSFAAVAVDAERRTVTFTGPGICLDFGGFGKGYALDRAAALLRRYGVEQALLHGGTSSVLAIGLGPAGAPWLVGLRDPFGGGEIGSVALCDQALSTSATLAGAEAPGTVDPRTQLPLTEPAACVVIADSAATAEIFSTALLCMGQAAARLYVEQRAMPFTRAGWISPNNGGAALQWIAETHE